MKIEAIIPACVVATFAICFGLNSFQQKPWYAETIQPQHRIPDGQKWREGEDTKDYLKAEKHYGEPLFQQLAAEQSLVGKVIRKVEITEDPAVLKIYTDEGIFIFGTTVSTYKPTTHPASQLFRKDGSEVTGGGDSFEIQRDADGMIHHFSETK